MTKKTGGENDPFSYEQGSEQIYEDAQQVVGHIVEENITNLRTQLGILAQIFFSDIETGRLNSGLAISEFLEQQRDPLVDEIDSWLDW